MKTNKRIWKLTSVVIALAMVVGLLPSGLFGGTTVSAATECFTDSSSSWVVYSWDYFGWSDGAGGSGSTFSNETGFRFNGYGNSDTGYNYFYQSISGLDTSTTYTLTATIYSPGWNASGSITVYPYVDGQVSSYSVTATDSSSSSSSQTFSYEFTPSSTSMNIGYYYTYTGVAYISICDLSLTCEATSSDDTDDEDDTDDTDSTTTECFVDDGASADSSWTVSVYAADTSTWTGFTWNYAGLDGGYEACAWNSGSLSGYIYQAVTLSAGTYTLSATLTGTNQWGTNTVRVYPYVDGQVTDYYQTCTYGSTTSFSYTITIDEDGTYNIGYYVVTSASAEIDLTYLSLTAGASESSDDEDDTTVTTISVPGDQDYVVLDSTFDSTSWTLSNFSIKTTSYSISAVNYNGDSVTYNQYIETNWSSSSDQVAYAYYSGQPVYLTADGGSEEYTGVYTIAAWVSGEGEGTEAPALYPAIYDAETLELIYTATDCEIEIENNGWDDGADMVVVNLDLSSYDGDYDLSETAVYIGLYAEQPASAWITITGFSWFYSKDAYESTESVLTVPSDEVGNYAVEDSDFSSGWKMDSYSSCKYSEADGTESGYETNDDGIMYWAFNGYMYFLNTWFETGDATSTVYYRQLYYLTADTFTIEMYACGSGTTVTPVLLDSTGEVVATFDSEAVTLSEEDWDDSVYVSVTIDTSDYNDNGEAYYVGLQIYGEADESWSSISGLSWYYDDGSDTLYVPGDDSTTNNSDYAVEESDFSTGWVTMNGSVSYDDTYTFAGNHYYFSASAWESDDSDEAGISEAYAYNLQKVVLTKTSPYTVEAYICASENVSVYPMIYTSSGEYYVFYDYAFEIAGDEWGYIINKSTVEIDLSEVDIDLTGVVYVGFYADGFEVGGEDSDFVNITDYSFYYGSDEGYNHIAQDTPDNGDFEEGNLKYWTVDGSEIDYSGDYAYGYKVAEGGNDNGSYGLTAWIDDTEHDDVTEITVTLMQDIQINDTDTHYLALTLQGELARAGEIYAEIGTSDQDEAGGDVDGDTYFNISEIVPEEWVSTYEEFVFGLETEDQAFTTVYSSENDGVEYGGFSVSEAGTVVTLTITITLYGETSDYINIDDIAFVSEDYTGIEISYYGIDDFGDGYFDEAWDFTKYWYNTENNMDDGVDEDNEIWDYDSDIVTLDEDNPYYDEDDPDDAMYNAYSNYTEDSVTFEIATDISMTLTDTYFISFNAADYIYGTGTLTVTNSDGDTLLTYKFAPTGDGEWDEYETGSFDLESGDYITVTVTIMMDAVTTETDNDGEEYQTTSNIYLDNFVLEPYVEASVGEGEFESVYYDGSYINGGNYVKGVDLSSIISLESAGTTFTDGDVFETLAENGVNSVRIRIWDDPNSSSGNTYGGGANDAAVAAMIAQRAADVGMSVMLSFHFSDFWADPGTQVSPKSWGSSSAASIATQEAEFVLETIEAVEATGANVLFVTLGNETADITTYIGGSESNQATIIGGVADAIDSARGNSISDEILIGIHYGAAGSAVSLQGTYMNNLASSVSSVTDAIDFFATSIYPVWAVYGDGDYSYFAGYLENIYETYGWPVMIAEYKWPYTYEEYDYTDGSNWEYVNSRSWDDSTSSSTYTYVDGFDPDDEAYAISVSGQGTMINDINSYFASEYAGLNGHFIGSYYWEPAWISVTNSDGWSSSMISLWYSYGCGLATYDGASYLSWSGYVEYSDSVGEYDQIATGSATDANALFNASGDTLSSVQYLNYIDDYYPIAVTNAQVGTASNGTYSIRFVGQIYISDLETSDGFESLGFKVEVATDSAYTTISAKSTSYIYSSIKANGVLVEPDDDYNYFYTYVFTGVDTDTTYYFKVYTTATGTSSYQMETKYYKFSDGEMSVIDAWEYPGSNADNTTTVTASGVDSESFTLYPEYIK